MTFHCILTARGGTPAKEFGIIDKGFDFQGLEFFVNIVGDQASNGGVIQDEFTFFPCFISVIAIVNVRYLGTGFALILLRLEFYV
jgi:hypothetical protein